MAALHLSQARQILDSGKRVDLKAVRKDGSILELHDAVSLRYDFKRGTRNMKVMGSKAIRCIHDVCIISINDCEVYI